VLANPQLADGELDRLADSFCVLEALERALDRRDVFVARSGRLEIQRINGMDRPDLSALERLAEPATLTEPRATVDAMLPNGVAFSEILLDVCRRTGFADAFTHLANAARASGTCKSASARSSLPSRATSASRTRRTRASQR